MSRGGAGDIFGLPTLTELMTMLTSDAPKKFEVKTAAKRRSQPRTPAQLAKMQARLAKEWQAFQRERDDKFHKAWAQVQEDEAVRLRRESEDAALHLLRIEEDFFDWAKANKIRLGGTSDRRSRIFARFLEIREKHYEGLDQMLQIFEVRNTSTGRIEPEPQVGDSLIQSERHDSCPFCGAYWEDGCHEDCPAISHLKIREPQVFNFEFDLGKQESALVNFLASQDQIIPEGLLTRQEEADDGLPESFHQVHPNCLFCSAWPENGCTGQCEVPEDY